MTLQQILCSNFITETLHLHMNDRKIIVHLVNIQIVN